MVQQVTTDERLADMKKQLAWLQLYGWAAPLTEQRKVWQQCAVLKRQIELLERNRGTGGGT